MISLTFLLSLLILVGLALQVKTVHNFGRLTNSVQPNSRFSPFPGLRSSKYDDQFDQKADELIQAIREATGKRKVMEKLVDSQKGLLILNRLVMDSFIGPTFLQESGHRLAKRQRGFSSIPSAMGRVFRGLTNLTVTIGRTIGSENVNGSFSRLITNQLVGYSEAMMNWVEHSVRDKKGLPTLEPKQCVLRCVCEAHSQPKKYGAVGLVIQLFFPPYLDTEGRISNATFGDYQTAALRGREPNADCGVKYEGCMVNFLELLQGAIDMLF